MGIGGGMYIHVDVFSFATPYQISLIAFCCSSCS